MVKHIEQDQVGDPPPLPPVGYDGHESIGFDCLRCGVHLKPAPKWRNLHNAWHAAVDGR